MLNNTNIGLSDLESLIAETVLKSFSSVYTNTKQKLKIISEKVFIDINTAFKSYLMSAYNKYSYMKSIIYRDYPVPLYDFYENVDLLSGTLNYTFSSSTTPILFSEVKTTIIAITGIAGTGKSTLLKHLFLSSINTKFAIPLLIELRHLHVDNSEIDILEFIRKQMSNLNLKIDKEAFEYAMNWGKFVIIFDGYDEVAPNNREAVLTAIVNLTTKYDLNYYILASRPTDDLMSTPFIELSIAHLIKEKALSLIMKITLSGDDELTKSKFMRDLDDSLYDSHTSFASNPLLLVLMLLMYRDFSEIPDKLHLFYERAYETLYSRHDSSKGGFQRPMYCNITSDTFRSVLEAFSFISYIQNNYIFTHNVLHSTLSISIKMLAGHITGNFDTRDFVNDLMQSVSLILRDGEMYTFIHRTFQEYFAACYIEHSSDNEQIKILRVMYSSSNRRLNDSFFSMLFDLDKDRITSNFLVIQLKALKTRTNYNYKENTITSIEKFLSLTESTIWYGVPDQQSTIKLSHQLMESFTSEPKIVEVIGKESFFIRTNRNQQYIDMLYFVASKFLDEYRNEYLELLRQRQECWSDDLDSLFDKLSRQKGERPRFVISFAKVNAKVNAKATVFSAKHVMALSRQDITIINYLFSMSIIEKLENKPQDKLQLIDSIFNKSN